MKQIWSKTKGFLRYTLVRLYDQFLTFLGLLAATAIGLVVLTSAPAEFVLEAVFNVEVLPTEILEEALLALRNLNQGAFK